MDLTRRRWYLVAALIAALAWVAGTAFAASAWDPLRDAPVIPLGQPIHFVQCSLEEALKARHDRQRYLEQLTWRLNNEN